MSSNPAATESRPQAQVEAAVDRRARRHSAVLPLSILTVFSGGLLQSYANGTMDAFYTSLLLLLVGACLVSGVLPRKSAELRAFVMSFSLSVLVGGLAQAYALYAFDTPMSTTDANNFFNSILTRPPFHTLEELATAWLGERFLGFGAPLAIVIWQRVYHVFALLGFTHGPYIGVQFNALVVGLAGSLTVYTARAMFGDDPWRLRRVAHLYAGCGLFLLFGAVLIRDGFTLFLNLLVFWGLIRWLQHPTVRRYAIALAITAAAGLAMWYLRRNSTYLFGLFHMMALFCWYWRGRRSMGHTLATLSLPLILAFASAFFYQYFSASFDVLTRESENYVELAAKDSLSDSLGMALVVNQPLPIRATLGSGVLLAFPIPLWAYLEAGASEYELIKTWQGLYMIAMLPLALAGFLGVLYNIRRRGEFVSEQVFIALYAAGMLAAVAATSLETRHIGQFLPAFILLAALPDTRQRKERRRVATMRFTWIAILGAVHLAWAGVRYL